MARSLRKRDSTWSLASRLVSAGRGDEAGDPLNVPLMPSSAFVTGRERSYARGDGTPTWEALEELIGVLEGGTAVAFASGMAAVAAVFDALPVGAHVVLPDDGYQGVVALAEAGQAKGRWSVLRLAVEDTEAWCHAAKQADLLWLESPSNPLLAVADLRAIGAVVRKPGAWLAVDNTLATSLNQRPLALGADFSVHSATKFLGGHSDLLAGAVAVRSGALDEALRASRERNGATPGSLEAFLALRGARTMAVRLERAQSNAAILAERLASHPKVERTRYPGLPTHPTHTVAREQLAGFGSLVSFDVRGGASEADAVCAKLRLVRHATSFGAVESSIERRAALRGQEHLPPSLLRLSVGIEDVEDLWSDLASALG